MSLLAAATSGMVFEAGSGLLKDGCFLGGCISGFDELGVGTGWRLKVFWERMSSL